MQERKITSKEISEILNIEYIGDNVELDGLNLCNRNSIYEKLISYVISTKFIRFLSNKIRALFLQRELYEKVSILFPDIVYFIVENPEACFYKLHSYLYNQTKFYGDYNYKPIIGKSCSIHKSVCIEDGVFIGDNVRIGANSVIKKGSLIKDNVVIGSGSVVSSNGFQLLKDINENNYLIEHAGGCKICEDVYIGDNCNICNSLFEGYTIIGNNTKIDNLVHVAHNCVIGRNCVLTAGVILSGTTFIEDNVWLAPNSTINNKVVIGKGSFIGIGSVVIGKVKEGIKVFGNPAKEI